MEEAVDRRAKLCEMLKKAGFLLRKWRSNSSELIQSIPEEILETEQTCEHQSLKTLGIVWDPKQDNLYIAVPAPIETPVITKRWVAKVIAQVFDVLGLVSPYTISAKILLQHLWIQKVSWDQPVPDDLLCKWQHWYSELPRVQTHPIARCVGSSLASTSDAKLHGFSDASEQAYGAAIYLVQHLSDGSVNSKLIFSKARVAPLKKRTIPQLELEAAKLLAQLLAHVCEVFQLPMKAVVAWTDSAIILAWLQQPVHKLKTFVANQVALILETLPDVSWKHVPTEVNPADLASRGTTAKLLFDSSLWWHGPPWLLLPETEWPSDVGVRDSLLRSLPELKATCLMAATTTSSNTPIWSFWTRYSTYSKLVRITAWLWRFINSCRGNKPVEQHLTSCELQYAKNCLIVHQQKEAFATIYQCLRHNKPLPVKHTLAGLCVSMSADHALQVTGRVGEGPDNQPRKLIPLSLKCLVTRLMVESKHQSLGHPGVAAMLSIIGHNHYITGLKAFLKKVSRKCLRCQQAYAKPLQQQLGILPPSRTSEAKPFERTGLDFAGPLTLREGSTRKPVHYKVYLCIFVCMATKAVHLEVCRELTTEAFATTFRTFCNRRGTPSEVFSDNGSNFLGAKAELDEIKKLLTCAEQVAPGLCAEQDVLWHFNPPRAPHFGGLWEAGVKAAKNQLRKLVAPHALRYDELTAVLSEVEAVLNSRPLVPADSVETEHGLVLTPGHFMIFRPMKAPPSKPASQAKMSTLTRWRLVQRLQQDFAHSWRGCYIQSLQARSKWKTMKENIKIGELVLVKDQTLLNSSRWPLGKIIRVFPGNDKLVRTVDVLCNGKTYRRPIHMLVPLQLEESQQDGE